MNHWNLPGAAGPSTASACEPSPRLLDLGKLDRFRAVAGPQRFEAIVCEAIRSYWKSARAMAVLDAATVRREAHKVKGSAGSLGLCRIAQLAVALDTATEAADLSGLVGEFEVAIAASARELTTTGIVAQTRGPAAQPEPLEA